MESDTWFRNMVRERRTVTSEIKNVTYANIKRMKRPIQKTFLILGCVIEADTADTADKECKPIFQSPVDFACLILNISVTISRKYFSVFSIDFFKD